MDNEIKFLGGKAVMRPDKNAEYHKISESDWDGIWYPADGGKEKIMIVVSGSDGGLEHAGKHAHFLADNGVPALAVALFKTRHTGKDLSRAIRKSEWTVPPRGASIPLRRRSLIQKSPVSS